jgi:hypothetical protein
MSTQTGYRIEQRQRVTSSRYRVLNTFVFDDAISAFAEFGDLAKYGGFTADGPYRLVLLGPDALLARRGAR